MVIVSPKLNMNEEKEEALAEKLQEYKNSLPQSEVEKIVADNLGCRAVG